MQGLNCVDVAASTERPSKAHFLLLLFEDCVAILQDGIA